MDGGELEEAGDRTEGPIPDPRRSRLLTTFEERRAQGEELRRLLDLADALPSQHGPTISAGFPYHSAVLIEHLGAQDERVVALAALDEELRPPPA